MLQMKQYYVERTRGLPRGCDWPCRNIAVRRHKLRSGFAAPLWRCTCSTAYPRRSNGTPC
jgi:hypothetical protein